MVVGELTNQHMLQRLGSINSAIPLGMTQGEKGMAFQTWDQPGLGTSGISFGNSVQLPLPQLAASQIEAAAASQLRSFSV
jgi:hypothetical protein